MSAPVTESELFAALRGYASTLEVQFLMEEELRKFQEKTLPRLLADAVRGADGDASSPKELNPSATISTADAKAHVGTASTDLLSSLSASAHSTADAVAAHSSSPSRQASVSDSEWVRTFLKVHVDDAVACRLPAMVAEEVQRQLRSVNTPVGRPSSPSPKDSEPASAAQDSGSHSGAAGVRAARGLPPLPPPPTSPPPAPSLSQPTHAQIVEKGETAAAAASCAPSAADEARRQREQILSAIEDIERQVNRLQRTVDQAMDNEDARRRRWKCLCAALDKRMKTSQRGNSTETESSSAEGASPAQPPLHIRLEQLLDNEAEELLLDTLGNLVASIHRAATAASASHGSSPASAPRPSVASQASRDAVSDYVKSPLPLGEVPPTTSPVLSAKPRSAPMRAADSVGRGSLNSDEPPPPPPATAPSTATRTQFFLLHPTSEPAPAGAAAATAARPETPASPPQQPAGVCKGVRSITTRGSVSTTAPSSISASLSSLPVLAEDIMPDSTPAAVFDGATHHNGLDGTAVRRPASTPRRPADSVVRESTGRGQAGYPASARASSLLLSSAAATAAANALTRPIKLGIDAVNIPSGVLPDALGKHGAVCVHSVVPHQLAAQAGVCHGDVLLAVGGRRVQSCEQLRDVLAAVPPTQDSLTVELYRHAAHQILTVVLRP
ncbi:hypothetical protein ABL78_2803 [Leptomonas seymouri]|uniref:PDZ domain-containing protein n=1 Tax=Leptomonas seymouri TaxID=5684 RepID=A0A0N0P6W8_LEPSE|nr:hypothetical protein ABL78_2803 [Leptomonas seymouri]|eukprot:KPI88116.1 hypothetical protein ABL78_2803 [Leptomonas seymouri]